jgi:hypothetical protein
MSWRAHFAPTELGLVSFCGSYKHSAPTELRAFAARAALRNLWTTVESGSKALSPLRSAGALQKNRIDL